VYTSSVLRGAPYAFIKFHLLIKKNNVSLPFSEQVPDPHPFIPLSQSSHFPSVL
jgi:hypothetical protein